MTNDELIDKTDKAITELVYSKWDLQKAYNYYNGVRDEEQFRYLEDNFGIGNPTSLEFTPLIKKHIDALIGEYLGTPIIPKVYCKDQETLNNIDRERQLKIISEIHRYLSAHLKNSILSFIDGKNITDSLIEQQLNRLVEDINVNFISEYEIASQNVIEYIMQSRDTDMLTKLRDLLLDLLISGYTFYRAKPTVEKNNVSIEVLSPLNVFPDRNPDSPYIKNSYRVVVRKWMNKNQILNLYGRDLSKEDIQLIKDRWETVYDEATYYVRTLANHGIPSTDGIKAGKELIVPGYPNTTTGKYHDLIPVYEVEWIETDEDFVMQRYETIRIGQSIYILKGKNENVIRSKSNPSYCSLSVNGVYFLNRSSEPYSLVLACAHLQDKYDILHFYRDNLIANSGSVGDFIDVSMLPSFLGHDTAEKLEKYIAYKKSGIAPIDTSQEGRLAGGQAPINTIFNGYDDTVKVQAIQAIQLAIDQVEQVASSITGVFRERLNGIEQKDAVTNVKIGQNNSFIITKQYYHQMDLIVNEMLLDCLNVAKVVFKKGLTGTLILGEKYQKVFTALPEYFTVTDHDIRITTSSDVMKDLEYIKSLLPDFIKNGAMAPDIIFEALTCKSVTDIKLIVRKAMQKQRDENNQLQQQQKQIEELTQQVKEAQSQLQKAQSKIEQLNQDKLQLEQQKMQMENKVDWFKAQTDRDYKTAMAEEAKKRTQAEIAQLYDGNPYNDKIKQIGV